MDDAKRIKLEKHRLAQMKYRSKQTEEKILAIKQQRKRKEKAIREESIYVFPVPAFIKEGLGVILDTFKQATLSEIFDYARKESDKYMVSGHCLEFISHEIVKTVSCAHWLFTNTKVLGYCRCKFTDEACKHMPPHMHMLVYHPKYTGQALQRATRRVLYERAPTLSPEDGILKLDTKHKCGIAIKCEYHLAYVCHYISCKTASKSWRSVGQHEHYECRGPIDNHEVSKEDPRCQKVKDRIVMEMKCRHNQELCSCWLGMKSTLRRSNLALLSWEERRTKLEKTMRAANDKGGNMARLSEEQLQKRVMEVIARMRSDAFFAEESDDLEVMLTSCAEDQMDSNEDHQIMEKAYEDALLRNM